MMTIGLAYIIVFLASVVGVSSSIMTLLSVWDVLSRKRLLYRRNVEVQLLELQAREEEARRRLQGDP